MSSVFFPISPAVKEMWIGWFQNLSWEVWLCAFPSDWGKTWKLHWSSVMIYGHVPPDFLCWKFPLANRLRFVCMMEICTWLYATLSCLMWFQCYIKQIHCKLQSILFVLGEFSPQTLFLSVMNVGTGAQSCSVKSCHRQPVETWTSCH